MGGYVFIESRLHIRNVYSVTRAKITKKHLSHLTYLGMENLADRESSSFHGKIPFEEINRALMEVR